MTGYLLLILGVATASFGASDVMCMRGDGRLVLDRLVMDNQLMVTGLFGGACGLLQVLAL